MNRKSRDNGTYYDRMFDAAVGVQPDAVFVTSYNECECACMQLISKYV